MRSLASPQCPLPPSPPPPLPLPSFSPARSFFRGDWAGLLYQDRFAAMSSDIEEALLGGEESIHAILASVADAVKVGDRGCGD